MKAINFAGRDSTREPGHDGLAGSMHQRYPADVFGNGTSLYNGNISSWTHTSLPANRMTGLQSPDISGKLFEYDVLNRLRTSDFPMIPSTSWAAPGSTSADSE